MNRDEVVGERGRLCPLRVRVGWHNRPHVLLCHREYGALQDEQRALRPQQPVAQRHAIHRHAEVVAAARQVEVASGLAGRFVDEVLDVEE